MSPIPKMKEKDGMEEFIDRKEVLEELKHYEEVVSSEEGMCVFLKGETGVGKTRLVEKILENCREDGFEVLKGRCLYHESTEPYLPFFEALGEYLDEGGKGLDEKQDETLGPGFIGQAIDTGSSRDTSMGFIAGKNKENKVDEEISFTDKKDMMFNKITELLKDLSKERPIAFFIDDLHWIDDSSAQLLHHVARSISDDRILLLGAYRPEELLHEGESPPLKDTLDRMKEEQLVNIVNVSRLNQQSISKLVENRLGRKDLPEDFIWTLYRESEGNPFYLREILDSLIQNEVITPDSFTWDPQEELNDITIPSSIKEITRRKIDVLDKDEKKVLIFASLIGTEFDFRILEEVVDMDVLKLLDVIDRLKEHGLIEEVQDSEEELYRFHHLQTRTFLYEDIGRSRKRISHQRIGNILEDLYEDEIKDHYFDLSRHFFEGEEFEKAYSYSKKAGERALKGLDIYSAIDYFERSVESLRKSGLEKKDEEYELMKRIGKLYQDITDWEYAEKIYSEMIERGKELGYEKLEALGLTNLGFIYNNKGDFKKGEELFEQAKEVCKKLDDDKGLARCYRGIGFIHWREGELEEAKSISREGLKFAQKAEADKEIALNYLHLGLIYGHEGKHDKAIKYYKKSLPPFQARNQYRELGRAHNNLGDQYMKKEEWEKAIEHFDKCIEFAEKIDNKRLWGWGSFNAAEAYAKKGDTEKASKYLEGVEEVMAEIEDDLGMAAVQNNKGLIHQKKGDLDEAVRRFEESLKVLEDKDVPFTRAETNLYLGLAHKEKENYDKAKDYLRKAHKTLKKIGATEKMVEKAAEALKELSEKNG